MTDNTIPSPTPGDALVGRVINFVGTTVLLVVGVIGALVAFDKTVPQILETVAASAVTGLVALLAGRTQR